MNGQRALMLCTTTLALALHTAAAPVEGWAAWANAMGSSSDKNVYICKTGGTPIKLTNDGDAVHARFSADGSHVFYVTNNDVLKVVDNKGNKIKELYTCTGSVSGKSYIYAYRPDPNCVLLCEDSKFYKIGIDGSKEMIHNESTDVSSEISISNDGTRMSARGDKLYKITVGGGCSSYNSGDCSASLSPDGKWLTHNVHGHKQMKVVPWSGGGSKTLDVSQSRWDNQSFSVNSNNHIVFEWQGRSNGIGVVTVDKNECTEVVVPEINGNANAEYPDFFVGSIPGHDGTELRHIDFATAHWDLDDINQTRFYTVNGRNADRTNRGTAPASIHSIIVNASGMKTVGAAR